MPIRLRVLESEEQVRAISMSNAWFIPVAPIATSTNGTLPFLHHWAVLEESYGEGSAEGASWKPIEVV